MKASRSILVLIFAALVLTSSTNFVVGMHLCMGEIKDIAFFAKAESCEQEQNLPPCHRHEPAPCCDDETVTKQSEDLKAAPSGIDIFYTAIVHEEAPFVLISEIIPSLAVPPPGFVFYDPPLPDDELTVKHQVFLI